MKLLDISSFYSETGGGVRTYHRQKLEYFSRRPEHHYIMVISSDTQMDQEEVTGGTIYRLPGFPVSKGAEYRQICDLKGLKQIIDAEEPDVIEVGSVYLDNWLVMASTFKKNLVKIGFYHADFPDSYLAPAVENFPQGIAKRFVSFWHKYVQFAYSRLDATFVASDYINCKLKTMGVNNTIQIPLGVDTGIFTPDKRSAKVRRDLGVEEDETLLLFTGRFNTEKGVETMLDALPQIASRPQTQIVLLGGGPIEDKVYAQTDKIENVNVHPFVSDQNLLTEIYASADIFLSPGPYETFGLSTLEALSAGLSVVVANTGGSYEMVRNAHGGEAFDAHDPASMANAVDRLLSLDYTAIGRRARAHVLKNYSWEITFDQMVEAYERLIDKKQRSHLKLYATG